jgi:hypothetical protein
MSEFKKAFAAARAAGDKEFTFGGKKYHTRTKEEEAKKRKPSADEARANATSDPIGEMNKQRGWTSTGNPKVESLAARRKPAATQATARRAEPAPERPYVDREGRRGTPPKPTLRDDEITDMTYKKGGAVKSTPRGWGKARC